MTSCIFIFRRDLRIVDNTGLNYACTEYDKVYPIFIFTPEQITHNEYRSDNAVQFMIESIKELPTVTCFYGDTISVLKKLISDNNIDGIVVNEDYTPYSKKRDTSIEKLCYSLDIYFDAISDIMLQPDNFKADGTVYKIFTPFYNSAEKKSVKKVSIYKPKNLKRLQGGMSVHQINNLYTENKNIAIRGGRKNGIKTLSTIKNFKKYNTDRNIPSINTTRLSPHLKFGTISVREAYYKFKSVLNNNNELVKQLYWRDFYLRIIDQFPDIKKSNTRPNFNKMKWTKNKKYLDAWKQGNTGFPLVDAGMREMNETGFMHNRVRMVVATCLIYNLHLDWRDGERYFSQMLIDSDVSNNNGNWKWIAGIESFSNDYYKAMSITSQTKRFDPDCKYIKKWIPELKNIDKKYIINRDMYGEHYDSEYPDPIVDEKTTRLSMIKYMKKYI
jgi:deoxyribodipyrimidine photo-lyase